MHKSKLNYLKKLCRSYTALQTLSSGLVFFFFFFVLRDFIMQHIKINNYDVF